MDKRQFWLDIYRLKFEDVIEEIPTLLTRSDIREAFEKALGFFRDYSEIEKGVNDEMATR